jgi:hypothetical protein
MSIDDYGIFLLSKYKIEMNDLEKIKNSYFRNKFIKLFRKYNINEFKKKAIEMILVFSRTNRKNILNLSNNFLFFKRFPKKSLLLDFIKKNYISFTIPEVKEIKLKLSEVKNSRIIIFLRNSNTKIIPFKEFLKIPKNSRKWYWKYLTQSFCKKNFKNYDIFVHKYQRFMYNLKFKELTSDKLYYHKPNKDFFGEFNNKISFETKKLNFILNSKRNHPINTLQNVINISGFSPQRIKKLYFDNVPKIQQYLNALLKFNPHKLKVLLKERLEINKKINQKKKLITNKLKIKTYPISHTQSVYLANLISGRNLNQIKIKYLNKYLLKTVNHFDLPLHKLSKTQQNILRASQPLF